MIYPLAGLVIGALLGGWRAYANGGNKRDIAQWAASFAILCALIGLFTLVMIERSYV